MQFSWGADAWELIKKVSSRWQARVGTVLTVVSFVQFIPNIAQYLPRANTLGVIILSIGLVAIFFAFVDVYREQKQKINKSPRLIIKPSLPTISALGGWQKVFHQNDLVINSYLDIRNSGTVPLIFSMGIPTINYDGALFETVCKKASIRIPSNRHDSPLSEKLEIGTEVRWSRCLLQITVPRKFNSVEDFFEAMLTPGKKEFELRLSVDVETLEGEKLVCEPISLKGNLSQILEDATARWETLLTHPQNLNDEERHNLVVALLSSVKEYYRHLSKT